MVETPGLRDTLCLVKHGIPYEVAARMSLSRRLAFCIIFGELEGGKWDWESMRWIDSEP